MLGAALRGGDPGRVLGLADVRHVVTPFPTSIPGARLVARVDGVFRYELSTAVGRIFFVREAIVAANDQSAFDIIRGRSFQAEVTAALAEPMEVPPPKRGLHGYSVARLLVDEPERTEIATICSEPALAVVTRTFDPGWQVTVDGVAVKSVRADLTFTAFVVPAGEHRIGMTYRPASFKIGSILSIASLVIVGALAASGRSAESI